MNNTLWVEKYRPTTLDNFIGNDHIKEVISKYIETNDLQNLIFYGEAGGGKTTLAKLLEKNLKCVSLYINASDENSIDTIRDKVKSFASAATFEPLKLVILDEADFLTVQAQAALRNLIETYSLKTRFILTCNTIEKIIDPLQSRCYKIEVIPPAKKDIAAHLQKIFNDEKVSKIHIPDIKSLIDNFYPDIRKIINTCQVNTSKEGDILKFELPKGTITDNQYLDKVLRILSQPSSSSFNQIRQIIADNDVKDFSAMFKYFYDNIEGFAQNDYQKAEFTITLAEMEYQSAFVIDKEINAMATIAKILGTLNKK